MMESGAGVQRVCTEIGAGFCTGFSDKRRRISIRINREGNFPTDPDCQSIFTSSPISSARQLSGRRMNPSKALRRGF